MEKTSIQLLNQLYVHCGSTFQHSLRVGIEMFHFARYLGFENPDRLFFLGALHDIGKLMVRPSVLNKSTKLTEYEFTKIKRHTVYGKQLIKQLQPIPSNFHDVIIYHHENIDGSGYFGLKGKEIPLLSRMIRIIDSYDVMINGRIYQKAVAQKEALKELQSLSDTHYDKELMSAYIDYLEWKTSQTDSLFTHPFQNWPLLKSGMFKPKKQMII
jgi:HD-GYP domain-containing protein (c-di-GMP phosphodiesterase class II)